MSEFVQPGDKERLAVLNGLSDAVLVGHYWRLDDLDGLTDSERRRLKKYRHETFGFEDYCERLVALSERGPEDLSNLAAVLNRWEIAFHGLRFWHHDRSIFDCERNPVAKVLIYEESRITGVRGRLSPGEAMADRPPNVPTARVASRSEDLAGHGGAGGVGLTDAILDLVEAIHRLADVMSKDPGPPAPRAPRSDRAARVHR